MDEPAYFRVAFRPNIKLVSTVRRFVVEFYARVLESRELVSRLELATHELLENAVSYAADGESSIQIEIVGQELTIKTWNRTSTDGAHALSAVIDEMNQAADPDAYYQTLLVKTSKRTDGSGLGLARIRAEAEMSVSYEIENNSVSVSARAGLPQG